MVNYSLEEKINRMAIFSRLGIVSLQFVANLIVPDHDAQVFIKPESDKMASGRLDEFVAFTLGGLTRWDGQYFLHVSDYGYTYENTLAFFPLFPLVTRQLSYVALFLIDDVFGFFCPVKRIISPRATLILVSVLLNNFIFVRTARIVFELTLLVVKSEKIAFVSAILFCFNPASIFFSAVYSESLYCYLTFYGLLRMERGDFFVGHVIIGLTGAVRSNGIVNLGFVFYEFLKAIFVREIPFSHGLKSIFGCVVATLPFAAYQLYSYGKFCLTKSTIPPFPDFVYDYGISNGFVFPGNETNLCHQSFFTLPYAYVQKRYWNVGLFNYYEPKQIPNFLLAAPMIYVIGRGSFEFAKRYKRSIFRLGFDGDADPHPVHELPVSAFPYVLHGIALTIFAILTIHVQVTTRLLASSSPLPYWYCARVLSSASKKNFPDSGMIYRKFESVKKIGKNENSLYYECAEHRKSGWKTFLLTDSFSGYSLFIKSYFLTYFVVGTFLFSNFLPWT